MQRSCEQCAQQFGGSTLRDDVFFCVLQTSRLAVQLCKRQRTGGLMERHLVAMLIQDLLPPFTNHLTVGSLSR